METNEMQVIRNIKAARERYGKTQEEVASMINVTSRTYKTIENHPFAHSIDRLNTIAKAIGCNLDEFFLPLQFTESEKAENIANI